jgi:hypothetical protein
MIKEIKGKKLNLLFRCTSGSRTKQAARACAWERECEFSFPPVHANGRSGHAGRFCGGGRGASIRLGVLLYIASGTKMTQGCWSACMQKKTKLMTSATCNID